MRRNPIYVRCHGGLGNQLFSFAMGVTLARKFSRGLILDLSALSAQSRAQHDYPNLLEWNLDVLTMNLPFFRIVRDRNTKFASRKIFLSKVSAKLNLKSNFPSITDAINKYELHPSIKYLTGHYENIFFTNLGVDVQDFRNLGLLEPSESFDYLSTQSKMVNPIGIHVRLGDYKTWFDGEYLLSKNYYQNALNLIPSNFKTRECWLFSDDPDEASKLLDFIPNLRIISGRFDLTVSEELLLLSRCSLLVISQSTLSWWAGFLANNQTSIISPKNGREMPGWLTLPT